MSLVRDVNRVENVAVKDERADVSALTYEQARAELQGIVETLEGGGLPLEESLALWERGEALASVCQTWLDGAKAKLEAVRTPASHD
jgi:exodeoxyribonuclease VII small subunit